VRVLALPLYRLRDGRASRLRRRIVLCRHTNSADRRYGPTYLLPVPSRRYHWRHSIFAASGVFDDHWRSDPDRARRTAELLDSPSRSKILYCAISLSLAAAFAAHRLNVGRQSFDVAVASIHPSHTIWLTRSRSGARSPRIVERPVPSADDVAAMKARIQRRELQDVSGKSSHS